jgi:hypothetical protein
MNTINSIKSFVVIFVLATSLSGRSMTLGVVGNDTAQLNPEVPVVPMQFTEPVPPVHPIVPPTPPIQPVIPPITPSQPTIPSAPPVQPPVPAEPPTQVVPPPPPPDEPPHGHPPHEDTNNLTMFRN